MIQLDELFFNVAVHAFEEDDVRIHADLGCKTKVPIVCIINDVVAYSTVLRMEDDQVSLYLSQLEFFCSAGKTDDTFFFQTEVIAIFSCEHQLYAGKSVAQTTGGFPLSGLSAAENDPRDENTRENQ